MNEHAPTGFTKDEATQLRAQLKNGYDEIKANPWDINAILKHLGAISYVVDTMLEHVENKPELDDHNE